MTLLGKIKWVIGILMVFILILSTNLIDQHNFERINDAVEGIYEDRLVAKDILFDISRVVQKKEIAIFTNDTIFFNKQNQELNAEIGALIQRFERTKTSAKERKAFRMLKEDFEQLKTLERNFISSAFVDQVPVTEKMGDFKEQLYLLAKIQVKEGGRQRAISQNSMETIALFTQIEIYFLIALAILIQIIVLYKPKSA